MKLEQTLRRLRSNLSHLRRQLRGPDRKFFSEIELIHTLLVRRFGTRDGMMIDVGAQFGESLRDFALFGWSVLAFEPDGNPAKRRSLDALSDPKVEVVRAAVSERAQEAAAFYTSSESTGISSLSAFRPTHEKAGEVPVTTLRSELQRRRIERVDFLKIDTEGYDYFVLRGFPWEVTESKPRIILCEFEDSKTVPLGYTWRDMAEFLSNQGYKVAVSEWFPIERYGVQHRWRHVLCFPCNTAVADGWGNLVAFRDERDFENFMRLAARYQ